MRETMNPAQEINHLAKMLSKFITSANKSTKFVKKIGRKVQWLRKKMKGGTKEQLKIKVKGKIIKMGRKGLSSIKIKKLERLHIPLKSTQTKNPKKIKQSEKQGQKSSSWNNFPAQYGSNIFGKHDLSLLTQMNDQYKMKLLAQIQRNSVNEQVVLQQQHLNSHKHTKPQLTTAQSETPKKQNKQKLFGRAAFHVAIAYHIYLKNLKESGADITSKSNLLDPTYNAKKLRNNT